MLSFHLGTMLLDCLFREVVLNEINLNAVKTYLCQLQDSICSGLETEEPKAIFHQDMWERSEGGGGKSRILSDGDVLEKAGVNFSHVFGANLPASSTASRPELAGRAFQAMGVSLVIHPKNPFVPTTHMNVRFFHATHPEKDPIWWFGGGYDLTPYYPNDEDITFWHQTAKEACDPFGKKLYSKFKSWCDTYFYLKHRRETRGVGGLFFDDFQDGGFENSFSFMQAIGNSFLTAYLPILQRRKATPFTPQHRDFQLYRRGRYVEFNLIYDRGTLFGLQTGGRAESILMSLPPLVAWEYDRKDPPGSPEANLQKYLVPTDWLRLENET